MKTIIAWIGFTVLLVFGIMCMGAVLLRTTDELIDKEDICGEVRYEDIPVEVRFDKVPKETKEMWITCYCLTENMTASGLPVGIGAVAVDPYYYDEGTLFRVQEMEAYLVALDTGHLVKGEDRLDIWLNDCEVCTTITGTYKVDIY